MRSFRHARDHQLTRLATITGALALGATAIAAPALAGPSAAPTDIPTPTTPPPVTSLVHGIGDREGDFFITPTGDTTTYANGPEIVDGRGNVVWFQAVPAGDGLTTDGHEFLITPQNTALVLSYDVTTADLTSIGGAADQSVIDGVVQ